MFDWRVTEDGKWEDVPAQSTSSSPSPLPKRKWVILGSIIVTLFVFTLVLLFYRARQLNQTIENEILINYQLWQDAWSKGDEELWATFIHVAARPQYQSLMLTGNLFARPFLSVQWEATANSSGVVLSPDLVQAELTIRQGYRLANETIELEQIIPYIKEGVQWQIATPQGKDFWGETYSWRGKWITLTYPERDEQLAKRIGEDIDRILDTLCRELGCPDQSILDIRMNLEVRMETSLETLRGAMAGEEVIGIRPIDLPAPTLVGLPIDEAGYQLVSRGYGRLVVSTLLTRVMRWRYGPNAQFFEAKLANVLRELALDGGIVPALTNTTPPTNTPLPLSNQPVQLLCNTSWDGGQLYHYTPGTHIWEQQLSNQLYQGMGTTSGHNGIILYTPPPPGTPDNVPESWVWRQQKLWRVASVAAGEDVIIALDAAAQNRVAITFDGGRVPIDLQPNCTSEPCTLPGRPVWSPNGQRMIYIAQRSQSSFLALADGQGKVVEYIGDGFLPFWLDDNQFGFVRWQKQDFPFIDQPELYLASVESPLGELHVPASHFATAFGDESWLVSLLGVFVSYDQKLIIASRGQNSPQSNSTLLPVSKTLLLSYDPQTKTLSKLWEGEALHRVAASPNGEWLSWQEVNQQLVHTLHLYHLPTGTHTQYLLSMVAEKNGWQTTNISWSADSNWVLLFDTGTLRFIAPLANYEYTIQPTLSACTYALWGS